MSEIRLKRVYSNAIAEDGYRILVDRLWPRGQSKEKLHLDQWAKTVAPSNELRKVWIHDTEHFEQYAQVYKSELDQNPAVDDLLQILEQHPIVTFVYSSKNEQANHAVVLREYLLEQWTR
ncbi:DUF488 family protein [Arthrobacter sp. S41]|uniref:DUF488 domain-containing protein n=1 Tax=Arthrobacter sp. S41 TaxID=2509721 RepID=UPI0010365E1D|nr:DUF488 family protein [Arthrobacter sp. S41]TAP26886.1 DUF488 family protein [Arthrobacter sp. S41]